jgi:glycosyltransferase involved in cell wall biosynthesis
MNAQACRPLRSVAFLGQPQLGGVGAVHRELCAGMARHGIAATWVGVAPAHALSCPSPDGAAGGRPVSAAGSRREKQAAALLDHLESGLYDAVIANVLTEAVPTNVVRHLSPAVPRIMIVRSTMPGTYAAARAIRDHVHATVAVSPRIHDDLVARHGFTADRITVIPNAVDTAPFLALPRPPTTAPLRLLSLGRVEDRTKGVLWLPGILARLGDLPVTLTVAGDGPDLERLREALAPFAGRVGFLGPVPREEVPVILASHDVFLMPSRHDGLPPALVEAMAAGCVPVASRIRGVTDFVVAHAGTGLLFAVGDIEAAADAVRRLVLEPGLLARLAQAGRRSAEVRFNSATMADTYKRLLTRVLSDPPRIAPALPRSHWRLPLGLRTHLPEPARNKLRTLRERLQP